MRVRTHLIAMPWAPPDAPSIQLACLKAHMDRALPRHGDCRTYSAFFSILHDFKGRRFQQFFQDAEDYREYVYMALYLRRFGPPALRTRQAMAVLLKAFRVPWLEPLSQATLDGLEAATRRYLERRVGPALVATGVNVVGFTLNFPQVYASVYAAEYLRRRFPNRHFLFVYGGCCASLPSVYRLLTELGLPGVVVVGEGERKLEGLVRTVAELPTADGAVGVACGGRPGRGRGGDWRAGGFRRHRPGAARDAAAEPGRAAGAGLRRILRRPAPGLRRPDRLRRLSRRDWRAHGRLTRMLRTLRLLRAQSRVERLSPAVRPSRSWRARWR